MFSNDNLEPFRFYNEIPFSQRQQQLENQRRKFGKNNAIGIILEEIDGSYVKLLCPVERLWQEVYTQIRKSHNIKAHETFFLYIENNRLPQLSSQINLNDARKDGYIYVKLIRESTFG